MRICKFLDVENASKQIIKETKKINQNLGKLENETKGSKATGFINKIKSICSSILARFEKIAPGVTITFLSSGIISLLYFLCLSIDNLVMLNDNLMTSRNFERIRTNHYLENRTVPQLEMHNQAIEERTNHIHEIIEDIKFSKNKIKELLKKISKKNRTDSYFIDKQNAQKLNEKIKKAEQNIKKLKNNKNKKIRNQASLAEKTIIKLKNDLKQDLLNIAAGISGMAIAGGVAVVLHKLSKMLYNNIRVARVNGEIDRFATERFQHWRELNGRPTQSPRSPQSPQVTAPTSADVDTARNLVQQTREIEEGIRELDLDNTNSFTPSNSPGDQTGRFGGLDMDSSNNLIHKRRDTLKKLHFDGLVNKTENNLKRINNIKAKDPKTRNLIDKLKFKFLAFKQNLKRPSVRKKFLIAGCAGILGAALALTNYLRERKNNEINRANEQIINNITAQTNEFTNNMRRIMNRIGPSIDAIENMQPPSSERAAGDESRRFGGLDF